MIYIITLFIIIAIILISKQKLTNGMIIALAMGYLANLINQDLSVFIKSTGISLSIEEISAVTQIVLILFPIMLVVYRSHKQNRSFAKLFFETTILFLVIISLLGSALSLLINLDPLSYQIQTFITDQSKIILTIAGFYSFWQIIQKEET